MRQLTIAAVLVAGALSLGACAKAPAQGVVVRDPIPPPPAGYAVSCTTARWVIVGSVARCQPAAAPSAVLRVRS